MATQTTLFESRRPAREAAAEAARNLEGAIGRHDPSHVFALFSGGHDSLCSTHVTAAHPRFTAAVHVNTGVGIERTREFVRRTCAARGWPLLEYRPPPPPYRDREGNAWGEPGQTAYEAMVMRWGFPGPDFHKVMYARLKERCIRQLTRDYRVRGRKVLLVSGARRQESVRRMGHRCWEWVDGSRVWCAPLVDWSADDRAGYLDLHALPRNPVALALCMSGECLCGCYARPGELSMIEAVCPATGAYLRTLEGLAREAGQARCRWGEKPQPRKRPRREVSGPELPLCHSCEARRENEGHEAPLVVGGVEISGQ